VDSFRLIITIDGPVASGKSTIAKRLAQELGIYYLGTGLLFRGVAYLFMNRASCKKDDLFSLQQKDLEIYLDPERFVYEYGTSQEGRILFDGYDITAFLKKREIDAPASIVSTNKDVRQELLKIQRAFAQKYDLVAEGRDVGSVVFPHAHYKFFLTASPQVRADRWLTDKERTKGVISHEDALAMINERDKRDSERQVAPLIKPSGAIEIDNSDLNLDQTVQLIQDFVQKERA
jgi:CMP/dCMP kinase